LGRLRALDLSQQSLPVQAVALLLADPRLSRLAKVSLSLPGAGDHHADLTTLGRLADRFGCRLIV
jgi:hypothetical protein